MATNPPPSPLGSLDSRPPHMAIYLDGMDQDKTDIPAMGDDEVQKHGKPMKCRCQFSFVAFDLKLRLIGGLAYLPDGVHPYGFFFPGARFPADTNANLESLRRILEKTVEKVGADKLPRVLYIQLDNTTKDNKNYKFLKYCAYLVLAG